MAVIEVPWADEWPHEEVREYIDENGRCRYSEITEDLDYGNGKIAPELFTLVRTGEIALLPVGDEVIIRPE
jgi:hypothetical protein